MHSKIGIIGQQACFFHDIFSTFFVLLLNSNCVIKTFVNIHLSKTFLINEKYLVDCYRNVLLLSQSYIYIFEKANFSIFKKSKKKLLIWCYTFQFITEHHKKTILFRRTGCIFCDFNLSVVSYRLTQENGVGKMDEKIQKRGRISLKRRI